MDEEKSRFEEIANELIGDTKPNRGNKKPRKTKNVTNTSIEINGDGNLVGDNITYIKADRHTTKVRADPKPGVEHIDESQVRRLHDLKDEIVRLEALAKKDPATHQRVWSALNKKMRVGAMRMIPQTKFKAAEKFLLTWIGQLTGRPAVQKKDPAGVEKRRITFIQTNMKKLDAEDRIRDYMEKHFGVRSLKQLPDLAALEKVYRYVASLRNRANKKGKA